jgi:membrane dipeptidase
MMNVAAHKLHNEATVCDMTFPWSHMGQRPLGEAALERMAKHGVDFVSLTVALDWHGVETTIRTISAERAFVRANRDRYVLVENVADIRAAKQQGKLALGFHFQGTNPVSYDIGMVDVYYQLGIRHMLMCYNLKNSVGDGCQEVTDAGLSRFGSELVTEMNRVGMLVDVSHTGYRTSMDVIEHSSAPVITSHSNPRALCDHSRNVPDDQLKACAASGGVIGVVGFAKVLGNDKDVRAKHMVQHIEYLIDLVGAEHVGLGIDYVYDQNFDMRTVWSPQYSGRPVGVLEPEELPNVTELMLTKGHSEAVIRGVLGENWLRVADAVWK